MSENVPFAELVRRLRLGAPGAAEEFLRRYGNLVRDLAHLKCLRHGYARPDLDSEEVHQSVVASFCVRVRLGRFENLDTPDDLKRLLHRMVRNKVIDRLRKYGNSVSRRGGESLTACQASRPDSGLLRLEIEEMLGKVRAQLTADEWDLVRRRCAGASWDEIARAHDDTPGALRRRHDRAVRRALHALGEE